MSYLLILEWSQSTPVGLWNKACSLRKASGLVSTEMRLSPQSECFHNWRPSKSRSWKFEFQKHKYDWFHPSEQRACHPSRDLPLRLGSRGWSWWSVDLDSSSSLDTTPPSKCSASRIVDGFRCVSSLNLPLKIYPLVAPRWGPAPEIVDPSGCFPEGPDPPIPLLSISEWIKSRGPSLAFVNQTFLLTLNLDKGTNTLEHFGRSKMIKGQAPQNILGMLWIFRTYMFYLWILWNHGPPGF